MISVTREKYTSGLWVRNLSKTYASGALFKKKVPVLKRVSFHVAPGEVLGIMGSSGSGKTTLANILLGMLSADAGEAWLDGQNILALLRSDRFAFRRQVQAVTQHPETALNPQMTIRECLEEVFRVLGTSRSIKFRRDHLVRMLESVMLQPQHLDRYPSELSGGELQRIIIARVIALRPKLIIADEPTSNLDMVSQSRIVRLMLEQRRKIGCSIIFISHDADLVSAMCDRVHYLVSNTPL